MIAFLTRNLKHNHKHKRSQKSQKNNNHTNLIEKTAQSGFKSHLSFVG